MAAVIQPVNPRGIPNGENKMQADVCLKSRDLQKQRALTQTRFMLPAHARGISSQTSQAHNNG
jgi:hypothetical protein